ncbi:pyridoxal phosphate-dependent transferase [Usnea florida]
MARPQAATPDERRIACPYPKSVEAIRKEEYPLLQQTVYLDHAGTTPYPRSLVSDFATEMNSNLFGNPHSNSPSSMLSSDVIESTRARALAFFKADPKHFDLIFVANATAAIKLVMDCISDHSRKAATWYSYHVDSHTSLVGVREAVGESSRCFKSDKEVDDWTHSRRSQMFQEGILKDSSNDNRVSLFAYPAQSNMNGRRLPMMSWSGAIRSSNTSNGEVFTLLDAAAYVATAQLDLSDPDNTPDFTALSFYKIFGLPDLGALIVRKASGHVLGERHYFGGGTVDMVINGTNDGAQSEAWHAKKSSLHEMLEDGTPASHSILALKLALKTHQRLFGSMENVSKHTCNLISILHKKMSRQFHSNGRLVCKIYEGSPRKYGTSKDQGPTIAFNVQNSRGEWVGKSDFERLAILNNIQLRTGGVCNPGGIASALEMSAQEMRDNYDEGLRCGNDLDEINGKPTGIIRVSLGAMSSMQDIEKFMDFMNRMITL